MRSTLLVILLTFAVAVPACAQFGGSRHSGMGGGGNRASSADGDSQLSGVTRMSANDQVRLHLTDVRLALKLTPEQAASWQSYENKVLAFLSDPSHGTTPAATEESAPKQIERKLDVVRDRLTAMEDLSDAAKKLYAGLTDEQKVVADRMLAGTVPALYSGTPMASRGDGRPSTR